MCAKRPLSYDYTIARNSNSRGVYSLKNTGKPYEKLVQEIYQQFVNCGNEAASIRQIDVQHNVSVMGMSGTEHQVDIYWEIEMAGTIYKTIVEVKDWSTPVKKEQLLTFNSLLQDIPGYPKGIYVSRGGFQSGALTYAKAHGIHLVIIDKNDSSMQISFRDVTTYYEDVYLTLNDSLFDDNPELLKKATDKLNLMDYTETYLLAPYGARIRLSEKIYADAVPYYYEPDYKRFVVKQTLPQNWFCEIGLDEAPAVRVHDYGFVCYNISEYSTIAISNVADYVITNLLENSQHYYSRKHKQILTKHSR